MKNSTILMITVIVLFLIFIFRKPIKNIIMTRGYKNNNFGNIRKTFDSKGNQTFWNGEIKGTDKDFKTFKTPIDGYRAMFVTLSSYFKKKVDTIEEIINRYAPNSENNTEAYIKSVEKFTGYKRTEPIDTEAESLKLVAALSYHENGVLPNIEHIKKGYEQFKKS